VLREIFVRWIFGLMRGGFCRHIAWCLKILTTVARLPVKEIVLVAGGSGG